MTDNPKGACEHYRVYTPFKELGKRGFVADYCPLEKADLALPRIAFMNYNILVMPRLQALVPGTEEMVAEQVSSFRRFGMKLVWETDDDLTNRYRDAAASDIGKLVGHFDAVTCTTPHLAGVMKEFSDNVYICANYLDWELWEAAKDKRTISGLVVGISGSATHYNDWKVIAPAMKRILKEYPHVKFRVGGYVPDYFKNIKGMRAIEGVPFERYPIVLRQFDIGLCPVDPEDKFNLSKSGIKAFEMMGSVRDLEGQEGGAAVVCTNSPIYRRVVNNNSTGLLVNHDSNSWYEAIAQLIEDQQMRKQMQVKALKWVKRNKLISTGYMDWVRAYKSIIRGA